MGGRVALEVAWHRKVCALVKAGNWPRGSGGTGGQRGRGRRSLVIRKRGTLAVRRWRRGGGWGGAAMKKSGCRGGRVEWTETE